MYRIEFSQSAEKQFYKLPKEVQERIIAALEKLKIRPYDYVQKVVGSPYFRLRVGDYRVILSIREEILTVIVVKLGHRKNIYD